MASIRWENGSWVIRYLDKPKFDIGDNVRFGKLKSQVTGIQYDRINDKIFYYIKGPYGHSIGCYESELSGDI